MEKCYFIENRLVLWEDPCFDEDDFRDKRDPDPGEAIGGHRAFF